MPLVHRLWGTGFKFDEEKKLRQTERPPTYPAQFELPEPSSKPCKLCEAGAPVFDLSMRCCLDRYESLFGSGYEHRSMFVHAREAALVGDFMPARRLVESYRRVFGPMAAVELKRTLWQSITDAQARTPRPAAADSPSEPRPAA
jgi:hypothetical protein